MLTSHGSPIHDLILGYRVVLMVHIGACARCFPLDDIYLHVLDFDSHQEEVDLPYNDIFQVVSGEQKTRCEYGSQTAYFQVSWVSGEGTLPSRLAEDGVTVHTHPCSYHHCPCRMISQYVLYWNLSHFSISNSQDVLACYITHSMLTHLIYLLSTLISFIPFVFRLF